jgi:stage V sporulation protein G
MHITEVKISLVDDPDLKLRAFATITLDDCFVVRGLKVIEAAGGVFLAMPSRKRKDGKYQDIAHPINNSTRKWLEGIVIGEYKEAIRAQRGTGGAQ